MSKCIIRTELVYARPFDPKGLGDFCSILKQQGMHTDNSPSFTWPFSRRICRPLDITGVRKE